MNNKLKPGISNFRRGDTRKYKITIRDKITKNPISVDGGKMIVTFKSQKSDSDADAVIQVVTLTSEADPANPTGVIQIVLSNTDTEINPGQYYYDFQFTSSSGEVTTVIPTEDMDDRIKILEDVSRDH